MSAGPQSGTEPMTSSVAGLMTSIRPALVAVTWSLSMKIVVCSSMLVTIAMRFGHAQMGLDQGFHKYVSSMTNQPPAT